MPKYRVSGEMTISMSVLVEAKSKAEAIEKAEEAAIMNLCHQCASGVDDEWSTSGELDSEVQITGATKED